MRLGAGFLVAVGVGLAGCKNLDRNNRDDRSPPPPLSKRGGDGFFAGRDRSDPPPHWLDGPDDSGKDKSAPDRTAPGRTTADPRDLNYDAKTAVKGVLAGFVEDPEGRKLRDVFISIEPATGPAAPKPIGVQTDGQGYFQVPGLKPGQTYILTASTNREGRALGGQAYVRPPNVYIRLSLVEGVSVRGEAPPPPRGTGNDLPAPVQLGPPDGGSRPAPNPVPRSDGSWSPVAPAATPPSAPAPASDQFLPPPVPPGRPDLFTDSPPALNRPPATSIPNPAPPTITPPPLFDERSQSRSVRPKGEFVLIDTLGRPRDFPSGNPDDLLLIEFLTTTCGPCKKAIPVLKDFQARWSARGVEVIGVSCDAVGVSERRALAGQYQRQMGLSYLLYVEPGAAMGPVANRFGVEFYPSLVLIDGTGAVVWKGDPRKMDDLERVVRERVGK